MNPVPRKPSLALIICITIAIAVGVGFTLFPAAKTPGLVCDQPVHDFGTISNIAATSCEYDFIVRNTGPQAVSILGRQTTCGCTSVDFSKAPIPVGKSETVHVKADWNSKPGTQE